MGKQVPSLSPERLVELARGIVTGHVLIVSDTPQWRRALLLIAPALAEYDDLATVLVPVAPHSGGLWDGRVPALVIECTAVSGADAEHIEQLAEGMRAALYPDAPG